MLATFVVSTDVASFQPFGTFLVVGRDAYLQESFGLATADGQEAMRGTSLQRFAEVKIVLVFGGFFLLSLHHLRGDDGLAGELVSQLVARTFILAHLFGDDVTGTFQGFFLVFHLLINKGTHTSGQMVLPLHEQDGG